MHAPVQGLRAASNARLAAPALAIAAASVVPVAPVWALQHAGYAPCELCYKERLPFYWGIPLAAVLAAIAFRGRISLLPAGYAALGIIFLSGFGLGVYHTGVEWHLWAGPSACTGDITAPAAVSDFLKQLQTTQVVRCDAPALQVAGLSLATWNAVLCLGLSALAAFGFVSADRARV
jgi:disulfide bond formation protein DsbB